jgi:type IX secretion system PorP/SprF family membrane protein
MKKYLFIGVCLFLSNKVLLAQSLPMYSQYMANMVNINPAVVGQQANPNFTFLWREQWVGLKGSPSTKSFTYEQAANEGKMGLGIQLFEDKYVNYIKRSGVNLFYSIKLPVSENGSLRMGLKAGLYNDTKNLANAASFQSGDMVLANNLNNIVPLAGAGAYYEDKKFYLGLSVPDLITFSNTQSYRSDQSLYQVNDVHFFVQSGYNFTVNDGLVIKPSLLLKSVKGAPMELDLNTNVWLENKIGLGLSYRTSEAVLAMVETKFLSTFRMGYAYDMPFKRPNSHEIYLRYTWKRK